MVECTLKNLFIRLLYFKLKKKIMSLDPQKAIGFETDDVKVLFTERDAILYSLGIGYSKDPLNAEELALTYELHDDFKVFPTFATCAHRTDIFKVYDKKK